MMVVKWSLVRASCDMLTVYEKKIQKVIPAVEDELGL